jgi:two-component sensor histidine kinase
VNTLPVSGHSAQRWSVQLARDARAVGQARAAVGGWLAEGNPQRRTAMNLIVTELVSNAVKYGCAPIVVVLLVDGDWLRLEVTDGGAGRPASRPPGDDGGWGLLIVERLADRWGVAASPTRAWCEFGPPPSTQTDGS